MLARLAFKILNPTINTILRTPLHRVLSRRLMSIDYRGRKTGRRFRVPVSYFSYRGEHYCFTDGRWWHNFKQPAAATLKVRGRDILSEGLAIRDDYAGFAQVMTALIEKSPSDARYYGIALDSERQPRGGELERAFDNNVMVKFSLTPS